MCVKIGRVRDKGAVRIDRATPLGNPFVMKEEASRDKVIEDYREYFRHQVEELKNPAMLEQLREIWKVAKRDGEVILGCWCAPKRCHGEVIKEFIEKHL